jgi:hypothetical protein
MSVPSDNAIPDLLNIGKIPTNTAQDVETSILEPIAQSERFIKFSLENKGILHSHSKIQFCLKNPGLQAEATAAAVAVPAVGAQVNNDQWLPLNIGVASLIQRATLRVGNKTLCEIDDFANFTAYRSMLMSNETMREKLMYTTGQVMSHDVQLQNEGGDVAPGAVGEGGGSSDNLGQGLMLDTGTNINNPPLPMNAGAGAAVQYAATQELSFLRSQNLNQATNTIAEAVGGGDNNGISQKLNAGAGKRPTWQISISDLFPFLKVHQLPLYMMTEQISLELVLTQANSAGLAATPQRRGWLAGVRTDSVNALTPAQASTPNLELGIDTTQTSMIADYIYYPQETMVAYANANPTLQFQYVDYRLSKQSFLVDIAGATGISGTQIRNVGGAGRIVSKVVWGCEKTGTQAQIAAIPSTALGETDPLMTYEAEAGRRDYNTGLVTDAARFQPKLTSNVKYNNRFVYPIDVDNSSRHFHNIVQAENGLVPFVSREEYSREGVSIADINLEGRSLSGGANNAERDVNGGALGGRFFWCSSKMPHNERVNSRGIEVYYNYKQLPDGGTHAVPVPTNYTMRTWLELVRVATLTNGIMETAFA